MLKEIETALATLAKPVTKIGFEGEPAELGS
jgi:hypothetical protein